MTSIPPRPIDLEALITAHPFITIQRPQELWQPDVDDVLFIRFFGELLVALLGRNGGELAAVRAKDLDTGPTVANDPRQFPAGILDVPLEKKRVPTPRQATDPSGPAARSSLWMWIVLLVVSIVLGIGAGVVFNKLGQ